MLKDFCSFYIILITNKF